MQFRELVIGFIEPSINWVGGQDPGRVLVSGLLGHERCLLLVVKPLRNWHDRRGYSTRGAARLRKRQTNDSCPVLSLGVPFCQSRNQGSSACYSLTCLLRFHLILAHTTLPPSSIAQTHTSATQALPSTVLIALHDTQGARWASYVLPQADISVNTQHCCVIGIVCCCVLPDFVNLIRFRWEANSGAKYHGQSA